MWLLAVCLALTMLIMLLSNTNGSELNTATAVETVVDTGGEEPFTVGDGSSGNPYQISTPMQLRYLSNTSNSNLWSSSFILMNDITITTDTWTPIGLLDDYLDPEIFSSESFTGNFNGNNHVITFEKSVTINHAFAGLFACIGEGAIIQNLGVNWQGGMTVTLDDSIYAGGISGCALSSTLISNCFTSGAISATVNPVESPYAYVGGIVGYVETISYELIIDNCYNTATINATGGLNYAGGIVGYFNDDGQSEINNCYNTGEVNAVTQQGSTYAGGITGCLYCYSETIISKCYNRGEINSKSFSEAFAGGIIGVLAGYGGIGCSNCYNVGDISGGDINDRTSDQYLGGLIGGSCSNENDNEGVTGTINNCYNTGSIASSQPDSSGVAIGGIAGEITNSTITNCFSLLDSANDIYAHGTSNDIGGIVGSGLDNTNKDTTNCFYNITPTKANNNFGTLVEDSNGETLLSAMQDIESFTSENGSFLVGETTYAWNTTTSYAWNFSTIWGVNPNYNEGLPDLRAFYDNYTITYQYSQSDTSQNQTQTINQLDHLEYTNTYFPREGYTYTQWTDGENYYDVGSLINLTDNITVWPVWVEVAIDFTITLNQSTESTGTPNNIFVYLVVNDSVVKQSFLSSGLVLSAQATASSTISIIVTGGYMTSVTLTGENGEQVGNRFVLNDLSHTSITITYMVTVPNTNTGFNNSIII